MSITGPNIPEGDASVFIWLAERVLGGAKRALGWGWNQLQWNTAQDVYDAAVIERHGMIRIFGQSTAKALDEIFADVYVLDKPTAFLRSSAAALEQILWEKDRGMPLRNIECVPGEQVLSKGNMFYVLGKPGAGKTTFLKRLAIREAYHDHGEECLGKVPIFVTLREYANKGIPLLEYIYHQFDVCHFPNANTFVEKLLQSGRAILLFDGLDEVPVANDSVPGTREGVISQLEEFARVYNKCHVIITCRIAATDYTFGAPFIYLELNDFSPDQVQKFVRGWFRDEFEDGPVIAERMLKELGQAHHAGIRELARNPLLLTLLCLNYAETLSFPARRVDIYREALHAMLKKWDSSRGIRRENQYGRLSIDRSEQMFARIAYDAFTRGEILFRQVDLEARLMTYLQHVPEVSVSEHVDGEVVLREIVAQHGIFTEQALGLFSYAHLTFQEYYASKYIASNMTPAVLATLLAQIENDKWREVFLLTASLLADGTNFMIGFEVALQQILSGSPHLVSMLRLIAESAAVSQAGYRPAATRASYLSILALSNCSGSYHSGTVDIDLYRDSSIDCVRAIDCSHVIVRLAERVVERNPSRMQAVRLAYSQVKHRIAKHFILIDPKCDLDLDCIIDLDPDIARALSCDIELDLDCDRDCDRDKARLDLHYAEAKAVVIRIADFGPLSEAEIDMLARFSRVHKLFYDCLQLAYVPDRRGFEDRMFLPPNASFGGTAI